MAEKKIVCLGGGSLYFPRAIGDLLVREDLSGSEIVLYDIDAEKVELMAAMGRRLAAEAGTGFSIRSTDDLADAVDGADFAISSIGGSGAEISSGVYSSYYHTADMYIPAKYGIRQVVGDTAGPAGMMMGLRSIPAYIRICREMEKRCPNAILFSHSNPMAVLCRAMNKYTGIQVVGVCHGVQQTMQRIAAVLELPPTELDYVWIGTNHYYWFLRVGHKSVDLTEQLQSRFAELGRKGTPELFHRLSRIYGYAMGYPGPGHILEFYSWGTLVPSQDDLPYDVIDDARGHGFDERVPMPKREPVTPELRRQFLDNYKTVVERTVLPASAEADYVSEEGIARTISAISHSRREVAIVNIANNGAIPNLPAEAVVEIEGVTDSLGVRGITVGQCPQVLKGFLEKRFAWQELVADAAVKGDRSLVLQALMLDEMAIHPDRAEEMCDELLEASKDMLPQFFGDDPNGEAL